MAALRPVGPRSLQARVLLPVVDWDARIRLSLIRRRFQFFMKMRSETPGREGLGGPAHPERRSSGEAKSI